LKRLALSAVLALAGCVVTTPAPAVVYRTPPPPPPPAPAPVAEVTVSEYIEPPMGQPAAVVIEYAPPPMVYDPPPPAPFYGAVWTGGYWHWWNGEWVWARGRWVSPPNGGYVYAQPYYELRGGNVVYVAGFWRQPSVVFVAPPPNVYIPVQHPRPEYVSYYSRPVGQPGVFVPAPPGSQHGIVVPAPVGTPPSVTASAPPVVRPGMVVRSSTSGVEVVAPQGVTRQGTAVQRSMSVDPHVSNGPPPVAAPPPPIRTGSAQPSYSNQGAQPHVGNPTPAAPQQTAPAASQPRPAFEEHPAPTPVATPPAAEMHAPPQQPPHAPPPQQKPPPKQQQQKKPPPPPAKPPPTEKKE
jgi:hypothetical protein